MTHLGQVIAGFKKGCNRHYWALTGDIPEATDVSTQQGKPAATDCVFSGVGSLAVSPQGFKVPSSASTGRAPLFSYGYTDVLPMRKGQLATQRCMVEAGRLRRLRRN